MKIRSYYIISILFFAALASCKKDNYEAPSSTLSGALLYNGDTIRVEQSQVSYELYQFGFGKVGGINSTFTQEGRYSALLFNGDYKLVIPNGQGPFKWKQTAGGTPDSIAITMNGSQNINLDVIPYYMIRTPQLTAAAAKVTGAFKIEKIVTDATAKNIERVTLYLNKTQFVSGGDFNIAQASLDGSAITDPDNVSLSVDIPGIVPAQNYIFARIGLKMVDVEDMIFSPVQKLTY